MSNTSSDSFSWTCETRIGITLVAEAATLSCLSVVSMFAYLQYQVYKHRREPEIKLIRSHLDLYLLGLLFFDLVQAVGGMMDIKWVAQSGVLEGTFCVVQGFVKQIGDVGVALCTLALSTYTFAKVVLRWQEPDSFILPKIILSVFVLFIFLITTVGYVIHRNNDYYGNTVYWCWITEKYLAEGIGLEYGWMWLAAALNLVYYLAAFLVLKGYLFVEKTLNGRYNVYVYVRSRKTREELRSYYRSPVSPYRLLCFPAAYIISVVPVAVVRIHAYVKTTESVPFPATVFGDMLFAAGGFINVMIYTFARPGLLQLKRRSSTSSPVMERTKRPVFLLPPEIYAPSRPDQVALPVRSSLMKNVYVTHTLLVQNTGKDAVRVNYDHKSLYDSSSMNDPNTV